MRKNFFSLVFLFLALSPIANSQAPQAAPAGTASISGKVIMGDQPASGIVVVLFPDQLNRRQRGGPPQADSTGPRATTDDRGQYRFANLAAGGYRMMLLAETYVVTSSNSREAGITLNLSEGQTVENQDFTIARGGVITGRVSDDMGRPVIAERINLSIVNEAGQVQPLNSGMRAGGFETDDRGIYRIYGLPAGRYIVSAGMDAGGRGPGPGPGRRIRYPKTFYPEAQDQSQAEPVEVASGAVTENINIRMGAPLKAYAVLGRAVDAETGEPVAGVPISVMSNRRGPAPAGNNNGVSNPEGEFRITGLLPGKYSLTVRTNNVSADDAGGITVLGSEFYSEPAAFEIGSEDGTGVEIKVHRGASIMGVVVIEGVNDPATLSRLAQMLVSANSRAAGGQQQRPRDPGAGGGSGRSSMSSIAANGGFRLSGLSPGNVRLNINGGGFGGPSEFKMLRIERNGAPLNGDLPIAAGESIAGVRIVLGLANGVITGRVIVAGGTLPAGMRLSVTARPLNSTGGTNNGANARVESTGEFRIENLLPGSYEVRVRANSGANGGANGGAIGGGGARRAGNNNGAQPTSLPEVREVVTVTNGTPAGVTLRLNLAQ
jgi:hypothetical protein